MKLTLNDLVGTSRPIRQDRRGFIGGSDAGIIMSSDEAALIRLWKEKRGEAEPEDLSANLIVHSAPSAASGEPRDGRNPRRHGGGPRRGIRSQVHAPPVSFSEEAAAEKHMAQLQHNMWVANARAAALSIITGGGKWVEMTIAADALYRHFLVTAGATVLALHPDWADPKPLWDRASAASDRGGADRRHERVQCLGRIRRPLLRHALGLSRPRAGQVRAQRAGVRGCKGSLRPWRSGQAVEVGRGQLRSSRP